MATTITEEEEDEGTKHRINNINSNSTIATTSAMAAAMGTM